MGVWGCGGDGKSVLGCCEGFERQQQKWCVPSVRDWLGVQSWESVSEAIFLVLSFLLGL